MKKISGLNYIRAIGAILIMLYHYTTRYSDIFYKTSFEKDGIGVWWGCWAVAVFFLISGFLTVYNISEDTKFSEFVKKRFIRLYPSYWICIIITTIIVIVLCEELFCGVFATVVNFTMLQGFIGITNVDGAYWTLRYELCFYIFVAFVVLFKWHKCIDLVCLFWEISIIILLMMTYVFHIDSIVIKLFSFAMIPQYAPMFIAGVALCHIHKRQRLWLSVLNLGIAIGIWFYGRSELYMFFAGVVILSVIVFAESGLSFKYDKFFGWIAKISYPLYLVHQNVGYAIMYRFDILKINRCCGIILSVCVSFIIAYLIHRFVEIPCMSYIQTKKKIKIDS